MGKKSLLLLVWSFISVSLSPAAIYQVTTTAFTGAGSITQALINANASAGKDTIYFSIPGAGPHTIIMANELNFTQDIHIDATTQTGYNPLLPKPVVELRNSPAMGILINGLGTQGSEIIGLAVNNCGAMGILLNAPNNIVKGCYIGIGLDGVSDNGNGASGIEFSAVAVSGNIIGGTTPAERNVISGNGGHGINVTASSGNYFIGNYIGINAAGTAAIPNGANGIQLSNNCVNNRIGGASADSANFIGGNNHGIEINGSSSNYIRGNVIGLQTDKTSALGNLGHGILIINANNNTIGGTGAATGNVIASNGSLGINVFGSSNTIIRSNIIGTSANTQIARGNSSHGIQLENAPNTIIGGINYSEGNVISGSVGGAGINFEGAGSKKTIIKGNYIGTDNTGTMALGNFLIGIILKSDSCTIGGVPNGEGNVIADTRLFCGLLIANANANIVQGNFIGVGSDGTTPLPNETDGINISVEDPGQSASNNIVQFNTIAYNTVHGINVGSALNNFNSTNELNNDLRFNSIYCNQQLGISLALGSPATRGNNGKTAPAINNALSTSTRVVGLANGLLATDMVDIYEMSDCINCDLNPQGKRYITTVFPDANGDWSYDITSPVAGTIIAMATDAQRNSSQFSLCFTPCEARAGIEGPTEYTAMLEMNQPLTITLNSNSSFSNLTPEPGRIFWSINAADTIAPALVSNSTPVSLTFQPGTGGTSYSTGLYTIYLIARQSGCLDTTQIRINVFFIPNMITPNGDQQNDRWEVGNSPGQFDAKIFNRWGDLVYSKSDYTNEWDGTGLGDGVYYYLLEDKIQSGKSYKGWVEILK